MAASSSDPFVSLAEESSGDPPCPRHGHSAVVDERGGGRIIIFGGCNDSGKFCSDLYIYNIENKEWSAIECEGIPTGRQYHSAVVHDGYMYIFAGNSNGYYCDLHRFHIDALEWEVVETSGIPPSPRAGHSAVIYNKSMVIFGGYDKDGLACNDVHMFHFESRYWSRIECRGPVLPNDVFHHSAVVHGGSMYVFGGHRTQENHLLELRFGTRSWSIVNVKGRAPSPRWGHVAATAAASSSAAAASSARSSSARSSSARSSSCDPDDASRSVSMYVFGGRDAVGNTNDIFELNFDTLEWKDHQPGHLPARYFASVVAHDQGLYLFGGRNIYTFDFNDLLRYDVAQNIQASTIALDFRSMLDNKELADVRFHFPNDGDKIIYAHKNVLAIRCLPFRIMFQSGMRECERGDILMPHISYDAFYPLLQYLYTGHMEASPSHLVELLKCADLYQLDHLKLLCERRILRYADQSNIIYLLQVAVKFRAWVLRDFCLHFIVRNHSLVQGSEAYDTLSPDLLREIKRALQ